ncbi:UrcA family protein [Maricaulis parjimensis]|uniref:UrcA family protein n=1 Tax=Maricaulis parjimensis TaxID=144023 RepID=UPI00193A385D|nr:UrcA family protein [Maricaulis parjimensis]
MRIIALAALAAVASAPVAFADQPADAVTIELASFNLDSASDLAALEARIEEAATDVCRDRVMTDLLRSYTMRQCVRETTAHAMAQLDVARGVVTAEAASQQIALND